MVETEDETLRAEHWRKTMLGRTWSLADRLIVRALTLTMDAAGQTSYTAQRLREEARDNRDALNRAVLRMRRGLYARPSALGEAALASLQSALALVDSDSRLCSSFESGSDDDAEPAAEVGAS
jgi:hypothetical protein